MAITRAQIARELYIKGGVVDLDGRRGFGGGATSGAEDRGYQGGGRDSKGGVSGDAPGAGGGPTGDDNRGGGSPNIHGGPAYSPPPNVPDTIGPTFGNVKGVDYSYVGPGSTFAKNVTLRNQLLNTPYKGPDTFSPTLNFLGNIIGKFGYEKNTKFFDDNRIGGKTNPQTGQPYGYGIEGYKDYISQRGLGQVDAFGNPIDSDEGDDEGSPQTETIPLWAQLGFNSQADYLASLQGQQNTEDDDFEFYRRFRADGGRIGAQEGGIMPRLNQLGGGVSSAEQMLQDINQRLESAESSLGSGGGQLTQLPASGTLATLASASQPNTISEERMNSLNRSVTGNGFYDLNRGLNNLQPLSNNQLNVNPMQLQGASGIPALGYAEGGPAGGIMDLETGRQMYGLGKLVKKVTRSIKKIAKSPIGKAALLYAGGAGLSALGAGSAGTGFGLKMFGPQAFASNLGMTLGKIGLGSKFIGPTQPKSLLDMIGGKVGAGIIGTSLVAGMLTPKQEEEAQIISDETGIDINEIRNNPNQYLGRRFKAEGGIMRLGYDAAGAVLSEKEMKKLSKSPLYKGFKTMYKVDPDMAKDNPAYGEKFNTFEQLYKKGFQEGGDVEPVAKKTMPLIDMDGKEKDYRETGGFVDMGRMERADDVPARLSKNEFVFTADAVRNAGDGSVDKGAEVMYNMMKNLESGGDISEESQGLEGARRMFQTSQRLEEVI